jgi:hypothetical protein
MTPRIGRRAFLAGCAGWLALTRWPRVKPALAAADTPSSLRAAREVTEVMFDPHHPPRSIGAAYLSQFADEADAETLLELLEPEGTALADWWAATRRSSILSSLRRRVRHDFATGSTVDLGGWIMSRTGARLSALWVVTHTR